MRLYTAYRREWENSKKQNKRKTAGVKVKSKGEEPEINADGKYLK